MNRIRMAMAVCTEGWMPHQGFKEAATVDGYRLVAGGNTPVEVTNSQIADCMRAAA
jgi:hypothetical protein